VLWDYIPRHAPRGEGVVGGPGNFRERDGNRRRQEEKHE